MTDFEKKMHHDGRLYGWAMLIAICAFPFFASVRSGIWPDFKIIWPGVLTMWILMASYVLSEMICFDRHMLRQIIQNVGERHGSDLG